MLSAPTSATAGSPFTLTVTAKDPFGNTATAFGGTVLWSQLPAYLIGEFVGGALGGLAWVAIGRVREDAAMTSLAPGDPAPSTANSEKVSGATS